LEGLVAKRRRSVGDRDPARGWGWRVVGRLRPRVHQASVLRRLPAVTQPFQMAAQTAARCVADPHACDHFRRVNTARRQILARPSVASQLLIKTVGLLQHPLHRLVGLQPVQRRPERYAIQQLYYADDIAAASTAMAVEQLLAALDIELGLRLAVQRTKVRRLLAARPAPAATLAFLCNPTTASAAAGLRAVHRSCRLSLRNQHMRPGQPVPGEHGGRQHPRRPAHSAQGCGACPPAHHAALKPAAQGGRSATRRTSPVGGAQAQRPAFLQKAVDRMRDDGGLSAAGQMRGSHSGAHTAGAKARRGHQPRFVRPGTFAPYIRSA